MSHRLTAFGLSLIRLLAYLTLSVTLAPVQTVAVWRDWPLSRHLPVIYHRMVCRIMGFRHEIRGTMAREHPTLFVVNHASYIDIEVLGAVLPASFVAKIEVRRWPLIGWLAVLQRSVFVDRRVRSSAAQRDSLTKRLQAGDSLILFPEGTSNDGVHLVPFKSSLFGAAEIRVNDRPVTVQPVSVAYTRLNGIPLGRDLKPMLAWYGDMALAKHMWTLLGLGVFDVVVQFHAPVTVDALGSRKRLAEHCQQVIAEGLAAATAGRLPPLAERRTTADAAATASGDLKSEAIVVT